MTITSLLYVIWPGIKFWVEPIRIVETWLWHYHMIYIKSFQKINIYENILLMSAIQHSNNKKLSTVYVAPLKKHEGK